MQFRSSSTSFNQFQQSRSRSSLLDKARQPCLQKRAYGEVFAITACAKGGSPLTPGAARLPSEALAWFQPWLDVGAAHCE